MSCFCQNWSIDSINIFCRPSSSVRYAKLSLSVGEENEEEVTRSLLDSGIHDVTCLLDRVEEVFKWIFCQFENFGNFEFCSFVLLPLKPHFMNSLDTQFSLTWFPHVCLIFQCCACTLHSLVWWQIKGCQIWIKQFSAMNYKAGASWHRGRALSL